jgi:hypothetical protein
VRRATDVVGAEAGHSEQRIRRLGHAVADEGGQADQRSLAIDTPAQIASEKTQRARATASRRGRDAAATSGRGAFRVTTTPR